MADTNERNGDDVADLLGDTPMRAARGSASAERRSRDAENREVTERRDLSDDERIDLFRQTLYNAVLPDLPEIPGYHVCWLSTTHQSDTIPRRIRLGYEPIKASEVAGFEYASIKTGEYEGYVGVNEMLAFKLPLNLYRAYMQEAHHDEPARQVEAIEAQIDSLRGQAERDGGRIIEGDGMADLRQSAPSRGQF
jgi:hypothetical protein